MLRSFALYVVPPDRQQTYFQDTVLGTHVAGEMPVSRVDVYSRIHLNNSCSTVTRSLDPDTHRQRAFPILLALGRGRAIATRALPNALSQLRMLAPLLRYANETSVNNFNLITRKPKKPRRGL